MTNPLAARFAGELALLSQNSAERFTSNLSQICAHEKFDEIMAASADTTDDYWSEFEGTWLAKFRPYVVKDGILQIPVKGVLLNNFGFSLYDWATGYDYIWRAFQRGCGDYATGAIRGIALICDTPGGMVAGCFDAVDRMVALKDELGVPVRAFAHESAYSAGYAIASVADHIAVSRTGGVGSIGVITTHLDVSAAMEKQGLKATFIASDPSKYEGNSYEPLSADAKARIQARIDELYSIFVAAVVRSRGIDEATVRDDLKAYCYPASQALSNGLADSVGSLEDATSAFAGFLDDQSDNNGDDEMAEAANESAVAQAAAIDAARAEGRAEGHATGLTEGATAERTRIGAILGSEEAKGRESLAQHYAFKTAQPAEDAVAAMAAAPKAEAPKEEPAEQAQTFRQAMGKDNPEVGATGGGQGGDEKDDGSDVVALATRFGLKGFAQAAK